jgi:hypothetical protein
LVLRRVNQRLNTGKNKKTKKHPPWQRGPNPGFGLKVQAE